ncbi:MAG: HAD family hydrolase [Anaplasmataceae bacterium]|nr:HAD family hydrolase [Anaplasmataceae bacterium]
MINKNKDWHTIIFDWDNTLIDSNQSILDAMEYTRKQLNYDKPLQKDPHLLRKEYFLECFGEEKYRKAVDIFYNYLNENKNYEVTLYPNAKKLIQYLYSTNKNLYVISNKKATKLREEVDKVGLTEYFIKISGSGDTNNDKPHTDMLHHALPNMLDNQNTVYIGDSITDLLFAQNCNIDFILINEESMPQYSGYHHIKNHKELLKFFNNDK